MSIFFVLSENTIILKLLLASGSEKILYSKLKPIASDQYLIEIPQGI